MLIKRNLIFSILITVFFIVLCVLYYNKQTEKYNIDGFIYKASHHFKNENYFQAIRYYKKLISMEAVDEKVYINLATILIRMGHYQKSIEILHDMEYNHLQSSEMYYLLAYSYFIQIKNENINDFKLPIKYLKRSIKLDSRNKDSYRLLGNIYEQKKQFEFARQYYKKASEEDIDNSCEFYDFIANTYLKQKKFDNALEYYNKALEGNKNDISAYYKIAEIYKEKGDFVTAEDFYKKAIQITPGYIYPYYQIGNLYFDKEDYETAIQWYKQALNIEPNDGKVNYYIGMAYKKSNDPNKAAEYLKISAYCGNDDALKELNKTEVIK